ncbi:MAG: hypothetical protein A3G75_08915 [Verrucomicrobia bacterium RIFCSPLOWO2_12_FULL_64_8]|nr:MAG: hypothetical protein A3G75_08915 [Verrucomicrobia bacterium RIFCSPLOWO2_12_FULL_64_8]
MVLYRYMSAENGLKTLQTKKWKIGRILELNDPLDCQPTLANSPPQLNDRAHMEFARQYFAKVYEDVGVICYSAKIDDPVVWSHYGDCHKGLALGFEYPERDKPFKVEYPHPSLIGVRKAEISPRSYRLMI